MTTYTQSQYERTSTSDPRSLGDLFNDLSQKAGLLARQEVQLAKVEMKEKATRATADIATVVVGVFLANAALLALVAALIAGLALFMAVWLAALIVGAVMGGVAALLVWKGINALKEIDPVPEQTVTTLKEDKEWLTRQMAQ